MRQHEILAQRQAEIPDEEWWYGTRPPVNAPPKDHLRAKRMEEHQFESWAASYRRGEIFAEWQLVASSPDDLATRIQETWSLWWIVALYHPSDLGMLWSWTCPSKGHRGTGDTYKGVIVMHPDDVARVRETVVCTALRFVGEVPTKTGESR